MPAARAAAAPSQVGCRGSTRVNPNTGTDSDRRTRGRRTTVGRAPRLRGHPSARLGAPHPERGCGEQEGEAGSWAWSPVETPPPSGGPPMDHIVPQRRWVRSPRAEAARRSTAVLDQEEEGAEALANGEMLHGPCQ